MDTDNLQNETQTPAVSVETESSEMSMEGLFAEQEDFRKKLNSREIVKVKVIQIGPQYLLVDIGEKKEGLIPVSEFVAPNTVPAVGAEIPAVLEKRGGDERHTLLSHARAQEIAGWGEAAKALEAKTRVKGAVLEAVKGGYIVDVMGVRAFMPLSLSELHPAFKHHLPAGAKIKCYIIEIAREKRRMIVSRKQALEEDEAARRTEVMSQIKQGEVLRVVVSRAGKDSLLVRYHGIEGVVRNEDISWRNQEEALKTFKRGQRLKAKLLHISETAPALIFGLRQLAPNPADALRRRYQARSVVKGKILEVSAEGMKISVSPDVQGFVPIAEFGHELQPKPGDTVAAMVMGVNSQAYEINLSIKRFEEIQNRKIIAHYLKEAPPLTLGQLLSGGDSDSRENG
ncbi:MAG: S1 RNA-binding domain-containing protein [Elusimicrobiales bacterium]